MTEGDGKRRSSVAGSWLDMASYVNAKRGNARFELASTHGKIMRQMAMKKWQKNFLSLREPSIKTQIVS